MRTPEEIASEWSASNRAIVLAAIRSRDAEHAATIRLLARAAKYGEERRVLLHDYRKAYGDPFVSGDVATIAEKRYQLAECDHEAVLEEIKRLGIDLDELSKEAM